MKNQDPPDALWLWLSLDPQSPVPLHQQLYAQLRQQILSRRLVAGTRVPSTRALARQLELSRTTTSTAYDQLLAEGYLVAHRGSGTFVAPELPARHPKPSPAPPLDPSLPHDALLSALSPYGQRLSQGLGFPYAELMKRAPCRFEFLYGVPDPEDFPDTIWRRLMGRAIRAPLAQHLAYSLPEGLPSLRAAIGVHLQRRRGVRCAPEQILITSGMQQALALIARVLLAPGDQVLIEEPHYLGARCTFLAEGADLCPAPVDDEGLNLALADPDHLARCKLAYVTPSHQFPLGSVLSLPRRLGLLDWARRHRAWIVEDDYDSEFRYEGRPIESLQSLDDPDDPRVIYAGTFSKSIAPALRLGYLVAPPTLFGVLQSARWLADWSSPLLTQLALGDFLHEGHFARHLHRLRGRNARRRQALLLALHQHLGDRITVTGTEAGLHLVVWFRHLKGEALPRILHQARRHDVGVYPVAPYYLQPPDLAGLLMGYTLLSPEEIHQGIKRLAQALPQGS